MVGCVLSQLKPSELYILAVWKASASAFPTAKNVELLGLYRIRNSHRARRDQLLNQIETEATFAEILHDEM